MNGGIISQVRAEGYAEGFREARAIDGDNTQIACDEAYERGRITALQGVRAVHIKSCVSALICGLVIGLIMGDDAFPLIIMAVALLVLLPFTSNGRRGSCRPRMPKSRPNAPTSPLPPPSRK